MKTIYLSRAKSGKLSLALAAAALLAGTAAPGVLAETYTAAFTKTITMTAAPGAGVPQGEIKFTIGVPAALPSWAGDTAVLGTAGQIRDAEPTATFTGAQNSVSVPLLFDSDDFTAPGDYLFTLQEQASGIAGLEQDSALRYIQVHVVNANPEAPDGTYRIEGLTVVTADGADKTGAFTNAYTTHALTVEKQLSGNFASLRDVFTFTITLNDPHATSVTAKTGAAGADLTDDDGTEVAFVNGTATATAQIRGGEKLEVTGLPETMTYSIEESGEAAQYYTTTWDGAAATPGSDKTTQTQAMESEDQTVTVTNTRNAPSPTGLLLDAAPYGAMVLAAGAGSVLLLRKRRDA